MAARTASPSPARWRVKMPVSIALSIPDLRETTALIGIDD